MNSNLKVPGARNHHKDRRNHSQTRVQVKTQVAKVHPINRHQMIRNQAFSKDLVRCLKRMPKHRMPRLPEHQSTKMKHKIKLLKRLHLRDPSKPQSSQPNQLAKGQMHRKLQAKRIKRATDLALGQSNHRELTMKLIPNQEHLKIKVDSKISAKTAEMSWPRSVKELVVWLLQTKMMMTSEQMRSLMLKTTRMEHIGLPRRRTTSHSSTSLSPISKSFD